MYQERLGMHLIYSNQEVEMLRSLWLSLILMP